MDLFLLLVITSRKLAESAATPSLNLERQSLIFKKCHILLPVIGPYIHFSAGFRKALFRLSSWSNFGEYFLLAFELSNTLRFLS